MKIKKLKRLGVMVLSLCALTGATQASNLRNLLSGKPESAPTTVTGNETKLAATATAPVQTTADGGAVETTVSQETMSGAPSIVDLVGDSEYIMRGAKLRKIFSRSLA